MTVVVVEAVVNLVVVEVDSMKTTSCPSCYIYEKFYKETGKACKMCKMILEDERKEFCSKICRSRYIKLKGNI